ncbi:Uclacyanin-3, partial [Mucuna pruriens]
MAKAIVASFLLLMLVFPTVFGTNYNVGDSSGWNLGVDYSTWSAGKTFHVGDTVCKSLQLFLCLSETMFTYDSNHALDEVNESGYSSCSSSNAIKNYQDGNTTIALTSTGKRYFLCPKPSHCQGGMKLQINVVAANSTPPSGTPPSGTPPSGTPPTTPTTPSGTPSTPATNTTAPAPNSSGAVGVSSGLALLVGSFFASAVMFGFMG